VTPQLLHKTTLTTARIATAPTRKLIYSLHAMTYTTNRHGNSTGRITDDGRTTYWTKWRRNTAQTENATGKA